MKPSSFDKDIFFATVRISISKEKILGSSIGTGFLFRVPLVGDRAAILLVSNKHVYGDINRRLELTLHKRISEDIDEPDIGNTFTIKENDFKKAYTEHPDPSIDLACVNVSIIGEKSLCAYYRHLTKDMILNSDDECLTAGDGVRFVGYPQNRYDTKNNLPIMRTGYIASLPHIDFEGKKQMLIDAQVFGGSSGSPVFVVAHGSIKIIGIVTQTMIRNQIIQSVPTSDVHFVEQILGLGIVLKANLLFDLFDSATNHIAQRLSNELLTTAS